MKKKKKYLYIELQSMLSSSKEESKPSADIQCSTSTDGHTQKIIFPYHRMDFNTTKNHFPKQCWFVVKVEYLPINERIAYQVQERTLSMGPQPWERNVLFVVYQMDFASIDAFKIC